ncbi:MAG: M23 family metallopeptidase [Phenylobacterium sp.]|nr:MAG: M23 family metallopeptidase [Phenylobacterium sp.]
MRRARPRRGHRMAGKPGVACGMPRPSFSRLALVTAAAFASVAFAQSSPTAPKLGFPMACVIGKTCEIQHYFDRDPAHGMLDYHCGHRSEPAHNAIDIRLLDMAAMRRGVDVLAAAPGRVLAVRDGVADNVPGAPLPTASQCGNRVAIDHGDHWITDYCHLERGTLKVKAGDVVAAGQPIAQVGMTGGTEFPHLHMSLQHGNTFVDPFAPEPGPNPTCAASNPLWTPQALRQLTYKEGDVLVAGITSERAGTPEIEQGNLPPFSASAPLMVGYTRVIGLVAGDEIEIDLTGPGGAVLAHGRLPPLAHNRDQSDASLAHARPPGGWPHGAYGGEVKVWRSGKVVLDRKLSAGPPL